MPQDGAPLLIIVFVDVLHLHENAERYEFKNILIMK